MYFFLIAFGLLLHVLFWGVGLAALVMPRPWRHFWPVLAGPAGLALQSLVVWLGAYANFPGTNSYAWWSEALPLLLLLLAGWWRGAWRLWNDVRAFGGLWATMAVCLCALVLPLARASRGLTTMSLGSCDAGDYAAGARVLMEFAHADRGGFLGLTEVVSVMSVDNFFDFWLRLNHFTPSALIAINGTVLDCLPHELTSLMTVVLLVTTLPLVFWMARAVMGYSGGTAVWLAMLYGFAPVTWYAVFQVAMGQLLAAQAIALLTWAGVVLWRGGSGWRHGWMMSGVLAVGYALLLGGYNFILLVCLAPSLAYAGGIALWRGEWRRFGRWLVLMLAPLALVGAIFPQRLAGLKERFELFQKYDFGWQIPALSPEGWLGMVANWEMRACPGWARAALAAFVVIALGAALVAGAKRRRREVYLAVSLAVPVLMGYAYLNLRGVRLGTNASYDAYKLFAVFYPGMLAALCYWVTFARSRSAMLRLAELGFATVITGFTLHTAYRFAERMETPPLMVSHELIEVGKIEAMPEVASVNMRIPDMWSRLWANAFLLRKPQYFYSHTYEGRRNTPLRGEWDLNGGLTEVRLPNGGSVRVNSLYTLVDTHSRYFMRARIDADDGWYDLERPGRAVQRWRWTKGNARIRLENFQDRPLRLTCRFLNVHTLVDRDFQVWLGDQHLTTVQISNNIGVVRVTGITVPAGGAILEIRTSAPLTSPGNGDTRLLGFRIFGVDIDVLKDGESAPP